MFLAILLPIITLIGLFFVFKTKFKEKRALQVYYESINILTLDEKRRLKPLILRKEKELSGDTIHTIIGRIVGFCLSTFVFGTILDDIVPTLNASTYYAHAGIMIHSIFPITALLFSTRIMFDILQIFGFMEEKKLKDMTGKERYHHIITLLTKRNMRATNKALSSETNEETDIDE